VKALDLKRAGRRLLSTKERSHRPGYSSEDQAATRASTTDANTYPTASLSTALSAAPGWWKHRQEK